MREKFIYFLNEAHELRHFQKEYFAHRKKNVLFQAKQKEKEFDLLKAKMWDYLHKPESV